MKKLIGDLLISSDVATDYWHQLDDGRIQCDLCPRYCKLHTGQRGACFVRAEKDAEIILTSYGRSTGFCIDPIEKKPLSHFLPGSSVLSFGTAGCNLACKFCQNWDTTKSRETDVMAAYASPDALVAEAIKQGCSSIAYTYNDPVIFMEYALDVAEVARQKNIKSVAVTAGYICEKPREKFFKAMDAVNIDLKAFQGEFYRKLCGATLEPILDTLRYVYHETNVWLEVTTLLIPGENDSDREIERLSQWLVENLGPEVPLHFSAFHPDWKMRTTPKTPSSTVQRARQIAMKVGLHYVYTGNIYDPLGGSTYCPACQHCVIERDCYSLGAWSLTEQGACSQCGAAIAGVFDSGPGNWGSRRQPILIQSE